MKPLPILILLSTFFFGCATQRFQEPVRYSYQLEHFGNLVLSNSPQFGIRLIQSSTDQEMTIHNQVLIKNIHATKISVLQVDQVSWQLGDLKIKMKCHDVNHEKTTEQIVLPQKYILFDCLAVVPKAYAKKDIYTEVVLPVKEQTPVRWSFILKAEDFSL